MITVGLIGLGYWGPKYGRVTAQIEGAHMKWACDLSEEARSAFHKQYPDVHVTGNISDLLNDTDVEAVIIATPAKTHYQVGVQCIEAGKHVLMEKPLTYTAEEADALVTKAAESNVTLMVGHIFVFNPAVQKMKQLISEDTIGKPLHLQFTRAASGPVRSDINALWDLAPHDFSILLHILDQKPVSVQATGQSFLQEGIEDVVYMNVHMADGILVNFRLSWLDPVKTRSVTVVGEKGMLVFDDVSETKLRLFRKRTEQLEVLNEGEEVIDIPTGEPLTLQLTHFFDCIRNGEKPITDGVAGTKVVRVLERAHESLRFGSAVVI